MGLESCCPAMGLEALFSWSPEKTAGTRVPVMTGLAVEGMLV